ncbi:Protein Wnt-4 [Folsomia candida]|uniref:Protein Wnt n=1 Tax=Folsomia candida TaxID=158441 RepID=A0A226E1X8_FOLCA|nr:Protein Wnt-4 [Folsomia candida]
MGAKEIGYNHLKILVLLPFVISNLATGSVLNEGTWWLLGTDRQHSTHQHMSDMAPGYKSPQHNNCSAVTYLSERQKHMCQKSDRVFDTISSGAKLGIEECQHQLQSHRWNCSVIREAANVFGKVLDIHTREKAYVHAISAASLAYQVTKACAKGELQDCSCDEDVKYGGLFSKEFADSIEDGTSPTGLMNLWNNEAGRRLMKNSMNMSCKCHGVSGSCTMKVCWRVLTPFRSIAEQIREKFDGAFRVKAVRRSVNKNGKINKLRLKPVLREMKRPTKKDLVFLDDSPTYCEKNETMQVLGTKGRVCNQTSDGPSGCLIMCCGRGYQTMLREGVDSCNCQFVWCCRVECDKCPYKRDEHICN